jgi:hypothetical protein
MWYVFVAELSLDPYTQPDDGIYGGFVGGQYASQEDALAVYEQARLNLKPGERIYPPFEADDPIAARQYIHSREHLVAQDSNVEA